MILDQDCGSQLTLSSGVEPTWGLREDQRAEHDDTGKHHLNPNRNQPRYVALVIKTAACCSTGNNGTDGPHDIVETSYDTTVRRMGHFHDVGRTSGSGNGNTKTQQETPTHKLWDAGVVNGTDLDNDANNDNDGPDKHADSSAPGINGRTDEGDGDNRTDLIHGRDNTWRSLEATSGLIRLNGNASALGMYRPRFPHFSRQRIP